MHRFLQTVAVAAGCLLAVAAEAQQAPRAQTQAAPAPAQGPAAVTLDPALVRTAGELGRRALAGSGAYAIVESLTTEVGPRLAGTPEEARAREWAVARLRALGLERVRVEEFEIPYWRRGDLELATVAPYAQPLVATALGGSIGTPPAGIEAEVAYFPTLAALESAPADSLRGRIAFVDEHTVRAQDGAGYGQSVAMRSGAPREAAKRGAVAALIRSVGTHSDRFAHTGVMRYTDGVPAIPVAALAIADANLLARMVDRGAPVRVRLRMSAAPSGQARSGNVLAEVRGRERPDEIVLLAAHLDSWDLGTGAIDDGAGVAIVTAAARLIAALPQRPRRTIRLLLSGAEEIGVYGGRHYAATHAAELPLHVMAAESDFGARRIWRIDSHVAEGARPHFDAIAATLLPFGVLRGDNRATGGADLDSLRAQGVPVADLYQDGSDYFDTHHTPNDVLERIEPADLDQNVAVYAAFAWLLAETDVAYREPAPVTAGGGGSGP